MEPKGGILMCNLKGRMDKGGHHDVEMKEWMQKIIMMWKSRWMDAEGIIISKSKGQMDLGGHYDVEIKNMVDAKEGNMMCELKGQMDKGRHYDVEIKGWMQKGAL